MQQFSDLFHPAASPQLSLPPSLVYRHTRFHRLTLLQRPLFWLALTPQRIRQLVLMLVLVGHSSYRPVQEILAGAFNYCLHSSQVASPISGWAGLRISSTSKAISGCLKPRRRNKPNFAATHARPTAYNSDFSAFIAPRSSLLASPPCLRAFPPRRPAASGPCISAHPPLQIPSSFAVDPPRRAWEEIVKFNLIDKIESIGPQRIVAVKHVSLAEEYLADHFPTFPVLPGVMMLEALVQAAGWLLYVRSDFAKSMAVLKEARNVKYGRFVAPGNHLRVEVDLSKATDGGGIFKAAGTVAGQRAVAAQIEVAYFNLADRQPELAEVDKRLREHNRRRWALVAPSAANVPLETKTA